MRKENRSLKTEKVAGAVAVAGCRLKANTQQLKANITIEEEERKQKTELKKVAVAGCRLKANTQQLKANITIEEEERKQKTELKKVAVAVAGCRQKLIPNS